jgi:hypothetical protein
LSKTLKAREKSLITTWRKGFQVQYRNCKESSKPAMAQSKSESWNAAREKDGYKRKSQKYSKGQEVIESRIGYSKIQDSF